MLKKTITYEDFNGETVSEDFFFHLSKAELVELEMSVDGGLSESLKKIVASDDAPKIITEFKKIILMSYGKRSDDGRRFIKSQELRDEFASTEAYSTLFMELVTDAQAGIDFINGIIPAGLAEEAARVTNIENENRLAAVPEPEIISRKVVDEMSQDELMELLKRVNSGEVKIAE